MAHGKVSNNSKFLYQIFLSPPFTLFFFVASSTGCDARAVHPATENWEVGINSFLDKMLALSQQTNAMVQQIQTSQFRTELE